MHFIEIELELKQKHMIILSMVWFEFWDGQLNFQAGFALWM